MLAVVVRAVLAALVVALMVVVAALETLATPVVAEVVALGGFCIRLAAPVVAVAADKGLAQPVIPVIPGIAELTVAAPYKTVFQSPEDQTTQ